MHLLDPVSFDQDSFQKHFHETVQFTFELLQDSIIEEVDKSVFFSNIT